MHIPFLADPSITFSVMAHTQPAATLAACGQTIAASGSKEGENFKSWSDASPEGEGCFPQTKHGTRDVI
jgi:hypothetical protein